MGSTFPMQIATDLRRVIYVNISLLMLLATVVGFWPTYFQPLLRDGATYSLILHIHVATMSVWLLLLLGQAYLAAKGNFQWHFALGRLSIGFGIWIVMISFLVGLLGLLARTDAAAHARGRHVLIEGVSNGLTFGIFLWLAIMYRRQPHRHRPLIMVTAAATLGPAIGRMDHVNDLLRILIWFSPIWLSVLHERLHKRKSQQLIYLIGAFVLIARFGLARLLENSAPWIAISQAILNIFA